MELERGLRRLLARVLAALFGVARGAVQLGDAPRILVVRLDARLGNAVLTTPLLASLRARFPRAVLHLVGAAGPAVLLEGHPALDAIIAVKKRPWLGAQGLLRVAGRLRRTAYDLAIDAGNPTDPSLTQALLVRFVRATHRVGVDHAPFNGFYSSPARRGARGPHEIDLRGAVLDVLPGEGEITTPSLPHLGGSGPSAAPHVLLNVSAGRADKRVPLAVWRLVQERLRAHRVPAQVIFGPEEHRLAAPLAGPGIELGPDTDLRGLVAALQAGLGLITPDAGPLHLAAALGRPTCALFVSTDPMRYAPRGEGHLAIDLRAAASPDPWAAFDAWLATLVSFGLAH